MARLWSDKGRHFVSNRSVGTNASRICPMMSQETLTVLQQRQGIAKHFKNPCDGEFGTFNGAVVEIQNKTEVSDIPLFCQLLQNYFDELRERRPVGVKYFVHDFFPDQKKSDFSQWTTFIKPQTLPAEVTTC